MKKILSVSLQVYLCFLKRHLLCIYVYIHARQQKSFLPFCRYTFSYSREILSVCLQKSCTRAGILPFYPSCSLAGIFTVRLRESLLSNYIYSFCKSRCPFCTVARSLQSNCRNIFVQLQVSFL